MNNDAVATADQFVRSYEQALATQQWSEVEPLIHPDACVTFSSGEVHLGRTAVKAAFEKNFAAISDETYRIANVHWVKQTKQMAVYLFEFNWSGLIDGRKASGSGRGSSVLINEEGRWQLLVEHLGPAPVKN